MAMALGVLFPNMLVSLFFLVPLFNLYGDKQGNLTCSGLLRHGKSCRLRWTNYLRPGIKRGPFSEEEENTIVQLHGMFGNR